MFTQNESLTVMEDKTRDFSLIRAHLDLRAEQNDTDPSASNVVFIDFGI
jgi:hypothetical protein